MARRALALSAALSLAGCDAAPPRAAARAPASPSGASPGAQADLAQARPEEPAAPPEAAPTPELPPAPYRSDDEVDLLVRGGEVVDGTGAPRRAADVVVREGRIVWVGPVDATVRARVVVDALGAVVTPGFVDAHAHADPIRGAAGLVAQGITTIVTGQDGRSPGDGGSVGAYLDRIQRERPVVNVAALVGHASVRVRANVGASPRPSDAALARMAALVDEALSEGAVGLSTGLEYDPGRAAGPGELAAIARPVGARGGVVMSHLRSEDDGAIEDALDELVAQARASGARAHVSHLKVVGGRGRARAEAILGRLAAARAAGVEITADWYPYTASYTGLEILFPDFARPPHDYAAAKRARGPELRAHLRERVISRNGPDATLFGTGEVAGKTLAEVAGARGIPFEEVLVDLGPSGASAAYFVMDEELQARLFEDPRVMVGSDGGGGGGHPRGAGTFARVIEEMVVRRRLLSLEEAVRRMTTLPLATVRLDAARGRIAPGQIADLLVFDPGAVRERASFRAPHRPAEGMRAVIVGGEIVAREGRATAARPGRALRAPWARPRG